MADIPVPAPGTVLAGKYRVERTLGMGGMAVVLEATHVTLGHRVAVKVLQGNFAKLEEMTRRFEREAQIAAQLPPEHIARVFDFGTLEGGEPFLAMELLVGRDLSQELEVRGALPIEEAVDLVLQACEGVAEAHAAGLVHRDLKPENLFLTRLRDGSPLVKVLDFGISKAAHKQGDMNLTKTSSNFGTPLFMSPEQIQSAKNVDARCDQHALGAILYNLLSNAYPFDAETVTALAVIIATHPAPSVRALRPGVPAGLDAAMLRALAKRPDERFRDVGAFARAIAPFGTAASAKSARATTLALGSAPDDPVSPTASAGPAPAAAQSGKRTTFGSTSRVETGKPKRSKVPAVVAAAVLAVGVIVAYAVSRPAIHPPSAASAGPTALPPSTSDGRPEAAPSATPSVPAPATAEPTAEAEAEEPPATEPSAAASSAPPPGTGRAAGRTPAETKRPKVAAPAPPAAPAATPAAPPKAPDKPKKPVEVFGEM